MKLGRFTRATGLVATTAAMAASLLVLTSGPAAAATTRFVATTGSDTVPVNNPCTNPAQPCRTVNRAVTVAVPGDTISVAAGTYLGDRWSVTKAVNIVGAGAASTTINANATAGAPAVTVVVNIPIANPDQNVTITGFTITGGRSPSFGGGGIQHLAGNLTVNDSVITGNIAGGVASSTGGGGIYVLGKVFGTNPTLALNNVTVSNNQTNPFNGAVIPGGGMYASGPVTMTNTTFSGNTINGVGVGGLGGGIYVNKLVAADNATVTGTNVSITGNSASFGGGVLVGSAASYSQDGGTISSNTAINGGGVYVVGVGNSVAPNTNGSATLNNLSMNTNTANGAAVVNGGNGGGILNAGTLVVGNVALTGNKAVASSASSLATGWGGGLFSAPIGAGDKPTNSFLGGKFDGGGVNPNAFVGGGVAVAGNVFGPANVTLPTFSAQNTNFLGNTATLGGGAGYFGVSATFLGGNVDGNKVTASNGIGGGLWVAKNPASSPTPTLTVGITNISNNEATSGGGLAIGSGSAANLNTSATVAGNKGTFGAGIINAGAVNATNAVINDNTSAFQGGGVWNGSTVVADTPTFTATGTSIDSNDAASAGGGVINAARATFTQTGGSVSGNTATAGGGLYVAEGSTASVTGGSINGNLANGLLGGGVVNSGTTTITSSSLSGNEARISSANTGLGGAIYNGSNADNNTASLVVERSLLDGNKAATASAIYSRSQGANPVNKLSIRNSTITNNTTVGLGGWTALVTFHNATITYSTITNNTSPAGFTGGVFIAGGTLGVAGTILSGNSGGNCNAPVANGGFNLTDPGDASCGLPPASRVDPQLNPLTNNGGPTLTQLPKPTSPAINAIPANSATGLTDSVSGLAVVLCGPGGLDQRGVSRPQGPACDIGAVEADLSAPTVDGPTNPVFVVGAAASYGYTSTGVPAPDLSVVGTLPSGLTFTDNGDGTGTLSGTPAAGTAGSHPITIVASNGVAPNDTLDVTIQINQPAAIQGPASDTYVVGVADSTHFTTTGVPTPTLSTASTLPDGVSFTDNGDGTADIHGTAADGEGGVYAIVIDATNGVGAVAHFNFTLTVNEAPELDGPASATYTVGTAGGPTTFTADGFPTPQLSISGDPLPDGVTFTDHGDGTGSFQGTPADGEGGVYHVTVTASNDVDPDASVEFELTVDEAPAIVGPDAVRFVIGAHDTIGYSANGFPTAGLSISGDTLPTGLSFTDHGNGTATLEGTAAAGTAGTYEVTITASNDVDPDATLDVTITVVEPVQITTTTLPGGTVGIPYVAHVQADGGGLPYAFSLDSGSLPAGLALATDGTISGTPTGPAGTSNFTVKVTDSLDPAQTDTQELSITISRGPTQLLVNPVVIQTTGTGLLKVTVGRVSARLVGGSPAVGIPGQTVTFKAGATTVCSGVTAADGTVTCTTSLLNTVALLLAFGTTATYAGNASWQPATGSAGLL